jgi:hypothetical protein
MQKRFAMAAMLAASFGAHAADNSELAAIRAQIDDMKRAYEQRIAALEQKLSQAEAKPAARPCRCAGAAERRPAAASSASGFNPEVSLILQGQYKNMKDVAERGITGFWPAGGHDHGEGAVEGSTSAVSR